MDKRIVEKDGANLRDFSNEFTFKTSRSSGPGGQHVNKTDSKVELRFDVNASKILSEEEKEIILTKLSGKINNDGELIITCQTERSQFRNKEIVIEKFHQLIYEALKPVKKRKKRRPSLGEKEKRLKEKKIISEKKKRRKDLDL